VVFAHGEGVGQNTEYANQVWSWTIFLRGLNIYAMFPLPKVVSCWHPRYLCSHRGSKLLSFNAHVSNVASTGAFGSSSFGMFDPPPRSASAALTYVPASPIGGVWKPDPEGVWCGRFRIPGDYRLSAVTVRGIAADAVLPKTCLGR